MTCDHLSPFAKRLNYWIWINPRRRPALNPYLSISMDKNAYIHFDQTSFCILYLRIYMINPYQHIGISLIMFLDYFLQRNI